jgi:hypothetical protein
MRYMLVGSGVFVFFARRSVRTNRCRDVIYDPVFHVFVYFMDIEQGIINHVSIAIGPL